jgi:hypothetical protein
MATRSPQRRMAEALLPDPVLQKVLRLAGRRQLRQWESRLDTAPEMFAAAYERYWETGEVPADAGELLFLATWSSAGVFAREQMLRQAPPYDPDSFAAFPDDLLHGLSPDTVAAAVEERGFYISPTRLPEAVVDDIRNVLDEGPATPRGDRIDDAAPGAPRPTAPTWWMSPADALRAQSAKRLLHERRLAQIAGSYLGHDPTFMSIALWRSFAWPAADNLSAQQFHYDIDRPAFIKMFVYLTDVDATNGPHTYVPRSHREKPRELLNGDRLTDDQVARHYPRDQWAVITGEKGTVFFADTQGFHKGGLVQSGSRAMFQINVASDRFGIHEPPIGPVAMAPPDLAEYVRVAPRYFQGLFTSSESLP